MPSDCAGASEIGFAIPQIYNASRILFDNLENGNSERPALIGPGGTRSYRALRRGRLALGQRPALVRLARGDRVLMFLDDTPVWPAAFFGAVRAGFVPLLINTLTPSDLLQFYLSDSAARVAIADGEFCTHFDATACKDTSLHTPISVNGAPGEHAALNAVTAEPWLSGFPRPNSLRPRRIATRCGVLDVFVGLDRSTQRHRASAARHGL